MLIRAHDIHIFPPACHVRGSNTSLYFIYTKKKAHSITLWVPIQGTVPVARFFFCKTFFLHILLSCNLPFMYLIVLIDFNYSTKILPCECFCVQVAETT